ncbi:MAG TPA: sugar-transfer associated ATP-grasp domain-containing protein [Candidatus Bipolaricaulota bacterium]|nr:sugar-transfer associated ATP-grasp domain-containing protein [Candidatus Bipolaricaulota bacterium]
MLKKSKGILGMNARNLQFVRRYNKSSAVKIADNKLLSKEVLFEVGLPVADLIAVISDRQELYNFDWDLLPSSFVLKPNMGLGGEGIIVTFGRKRNGVWIMSKDREITLDEIKEHASNILDGDYSKSHASDIAFFEERLKIHPSFKLYAYKGIPDIRIIVFNGVPVMSMLRLPTKDSGGKANLHMGGIGVGIDITTGITTRAILNNKLIEYLPGTRFPMSGIKIPFWNKILEIAIESQQATKLNYLGVDVAIDREKGPVILELNAHPGLSIQIANMAPLKERLLRVQGLKIKTVAKGIKVAKELFGGDVEQEIEEISGKQVVGIIEQVKILGKNKTKAVEIEAKIDTGAGISAIDEELAIELGFQEAIDYYNSFNIKSVLTREEMEELSAKKVFKELEKHPDIVAVAKTLSSHGATYRIEVPVTINLSGFDINTRVSVVSRKELAYQAIIGRRDLQRFLVDPSK